MVSEDFTVMGSRFQIVGAATEKAHLSIVSLALGTQSFLETILYIIYIHLYIFIYVYIYVYIHLYNGQMTYA